MTKCFFGLFIKVGTTWGTLGGYYGLKMGTAFSKWVEKFSLWAPPIGYYSIVVVDEMLVTDGKKMFLVICTESASKMTFFA